MKKTFIFIAFTAFILSLCSCSTADDEGFTPNPEAGVQLSTDAFGRFLTSVDSINAEYTASIESETRGGNDYLVQAGKSGAVTLADAAGRAAGGYVGKYLGTAAGSATGNPGFAILGYVGGRYLGRIIGGAGASFAARHIINRWASRYDALKIGSFNNAAMDSTNRTVEFGYYIPTYQNDSLNEDSLGYYHNLLMAVMGQHPEKYKTDNGDINYSLVYQDCVSILREKGVINETNDSIVMDSAFAQAIQDYAKQTAGHVSDFENNKISFDDIKSVMASDLKKLNVPNEQITMFSDFATRVSDACQNMDYKEKVEYGNAIMNAIDKSSMPSEMKNDAASTANQVINSSICWDK